MNTFKVFILKIKSRAIIYFTMFNYFFTNEYTSIILDIFVISYFPISFSLFRSYLKHIKSESNNIRKKCSKSLKIWGLKSKLK